MGQIQTWALGVGSASAEGVGLAEQAFRAQTDSRRPAVKARRSYGWRRRLPAPGKSPTHATVSPSESSLTIGRYMRRAPQLHRYPVSSNRRRENDRVSSVSFAIVIVIKPEGGGKIPSNLTSGHQSSSHVKIHSLPHMPFANCVSASFRAAANASSKSRADFAGTTSSTFTLGPLSLDQLRKFRILMLLP